jgi:HlyD family secretion protein
MVAPPRDDIARTLGIDAASRRKGARWRWVIAVALVLAALGAGWYVVFEAADGTAPRYLTAAVTRGDLDVTVTATGTLQPTNEVDISSELSGIVRKVLVDYNDQVRNGQVLAELDTDKLEAEVARARAALAASRARVKEAEASVIQAKNDFDRYSRLVEAKTASEQRFEEARATYDRAVASRESAQADVAVAEADLMLKEADLKKTCICAPIDGVVLSRDVEPGQTVAATLQAPVLFTLAENLTAMELQVDVDEADVGLVESGQSARFTVDAYPDRSFSATVTKVRFAPETTEGVVTYTTHLSVDNSELLLRPGMTATSEISVRHLKDALLIPNEALRFVPSEPEAQDEGGGLLRSILPRPTVRTTSRNPSEAGSGNQRRIWVLTGGEPVAIPVTIGLSDGRMTAIEAGDLQPGQDVIIDVEESAR